ncbi:hypothetical protein RDWZM_006654 [Blomia tropicalis]|uniref:C2H2-type domain-containing protein n=1 Tax=Blomia tropicalis TaxID=40697 RepID=A0A9Q0MA84_BLOTA|nr:hypothetical protein RDWZM_006654 [Blomia tropicalis]
MPSITGCEHYCEPLSATIADSTFPRQTTNRKYIKPIKVPSIVLELIKQRSVDDDICHSDFKLTMAEEVVQADPESITDIQDYLQSFNKEIAAGATTGDPSTATTANSNATMIGDTIYTIEGQKLTGNIVLAAESGEQGEQEGNYSTFMVVDNASQQQLYLYVADPNDPSSADGEPQQTLVMATVNPEATADGTDGAQVNFVTTPATTAQTPTTTGGRKRSLRNKRVKQENQEDSRNDISVYDFNEMAPSANNRSNANVDSSIDATVQDDEPMDDDDDPDFKTPVTTRTTRAKGTKSGESTGKKAKASSTSNALMSSPSMSSGGSNVHVCTYCSYTSNKRYLLSRHLKSHSEDRPHKCGICERGFKTLASLQNHVNTHTGVRPHQCKFCDAAFTTSGELVRHIRYRHTHEKPHRCKECDYASVELSKLKRHMRCHTGERPYQCSHCTYASPDTYKLKRHLRIHTGEKPYVCDVCHQRFTQSNSLKAHRLIHTGNKPIFKCEFCPTTCGRKTDLRIHVQKLHTSDKMLTCKRCDQSFPDRYQFKLHLKTHEGEKCFKCDLCNYASVSARHLESHMLIHTDQKPFTCDVCALSFRQKQLLKRHKNLYHNPNYVPPTPKEKTHECSQCKKAFRHKGNLIRHMTLHDPESNPKLSSDPNSINHSQLIDDEIYEDEDDLEDQIDEEDDDVDDDVDDTSVSIVGIDSSTASVGTDGTIAITIDSQTQQLIDQVNQGSGDPVMFVVQYPQDANAEGNDNAASNGQQAATTVVVAAPPPTSTPRIISRAGRVTRSAAKASVAQYFETIPEEKPSTSNGGENVIQVQQAPQISFDANVSIDLESQLQKQKDLDTCFGFKDEDDEDDIILSMPAVDGQ